MDKMRREARLPSSRTAHHQSRTSSDKVSGLLADHGPDVHKWIAGVADHELPHVMERTICKIVRDSFGYQRPLDGCASLTGILDCILDG